MQLETINKLYLELSQVATAKTARELELEAACAQMRDALINAQDLLPNQGGPAWNKVAQALSIDAGRDYIRKS